MGWQETVRQLRALVRAAIRTEVRAGPWVWMSTIMVLAAVGICELPIPFWTPTIATTAVLGSNIAIIIITSSIACTYTTGIRSVGPAGPALTAYALTAGRISVGSTAAITAVAAQALLFRSLQDQDATPPYDFIRHGALVGLWLIALLAPWALLLRRLLGPATAPWALFGLILVAAWLRAADDRPLGLFRAVIPLLPTQSALGPLLRPASWVYLMAHAACVTLAAAALATTPRARHG